MNSESYINKENETKNNNEQVPNHNSTKENKNNDINIKNNNLDITSNNKQKNKDKELSNKIPISIFFNDYYKNVDSKIKNNKTKNGKYIIDINEVLGKKGTKIPISLDILNESFEKFQKSRISTREFGIIKAYAANTHQGIIRDYNEDRVSIVINMEKPKSCTIDDSEWPRICFFGIFDGHAGNKCAEYLKDNLIKKISNNKFFPKDIKRAINLGFLSAEKDFIENYAIQDGKLIDKSGSCALILLTINNILYVANVGDSRGVISCINGKILKDVTRDHKPNYPNEKERILKNNGSIYQSETPIDLELDNENDNIYKDKVILGPYRVIPGRLSVSRTLGDAEAKVPELGGNPNIIIPNPEIFTFDLEKDDVDFIILGCDGIYDQLSSKDVLDCAWMVLNNLIDEIQNDLNESCGKIVDMILKMSMARQSYDNVTCLIIAFKNRNDFQNESRNLKKENVLNSYNEISSFFNKIKNNDKPIFKTNKNQKKTILSNKDKLPYLKLLNKNNNNNFKLKKLFKNNNNLFININRYRINNKLRNISVPSHQIINNKKCITLHKIENHNFRNDNNNNSENLLISNKNKKNFYNDVNLDNLTDPNINNNLDNKIVEKENKIYISNRNSRKNLISLKKNNSNKSINNDLNINKSVSILSKKSILSNQETPNTIKNNSFLNGNTSESNNIKFNSAKKKKTILTESNLIHNSDRIFNKKILNLKLKSINDKLPLYQKNFIDHLTSKNGSFFNNLERNKKINLALINKKINLLTYDNIPNVIKKDNITNILNNKKLSTSIDDKNNNTKPIKLKLESFNKNKKIHSNSSSKYNLLELNNNEIKMPLINQQRKTDN